ncbi:MAG TPA: hypothetical protein VFD41_11185 [Actinomycetales bacterium]|nr:hypothetical protein [Actinomycetales bacterium]
MSSETPNETADAVEVTSDDEGRVMEMLGDHVPLSLIMDLSAPAGPDSARILDDEGEPESKWWEPTP